MTSGHRTKQQPEDLGLMSWLNAIAPMAKTTCLVLFSIFLNRTLGERTRRGAIPHSGKLVHLLLLS